MLARGDDFAFFSDLLEKMPALLIGFDAKNQICLWNRACALTTGFSQDEIVGVEDGFSQLFPQTGMGRQILSYWLSRNEPFQDYDTVISCKNGKLKNIRWTSLQGRFPLGPGFFERAMLGYDRPGYADPAPETSPPPPTPGPPKERNEKPFWQSLSREVLIAHNQDMEAALYEMTKTNAALSRLLKILYLEKDRIIKKANQMAQYKILTALEEIRKCGTMDECLQKLRNFHDNVGEFFESPSVPDGDTAALSPTESQIAAMIADGLTSAEIADKMCISPNTLKTHRRNIRKKLNIHNTGLNLDTFLKKR
jgi:DNA-binding CsgD family transcriptional regulator